MVAVVIELFLVYRRRPNWKYWTLCPSIFLYMYLIFATIVRSVKGFAVYGILDSPLYLTILFILIGPLMWLLGYLVTLVHNWYWSERRIRSYQLSPKQLLEESNKIEA